MSEPAGTSSEAVTSASSSHSSPGWRKNPQTSVLAGVMSRPLLQSSAMNVKYDTAISAPAPCWADHEQAPAAFRRVLINGAGHGWLRVRVPDQDQQFVFI